MRFFLISLLVYGALTALVADWVGATTAEWSFTMGHFAVAAAGNAFLLHVIQTRSLAFLGSPGVGFLVMNQLYLTVNALKYFSPILLYPQFDLGIESQFLGSLAGAAVLFLGMLILSRRGGPKAAVVIAWLRAYWPTLCWLLVVSVIGSVIAKWALYLLGYGSEYTGSVYTEHAVRGYADFFLLFARDTFGLIDLLLGMLVLLGGGRVGRAGIPMRVIGGLAVLLELAYSLLYLKARAILLVVVVLFALASEVVSSRRAARVLQLVFLLLPVASLLGLQLTLAIGRLNVPEEAGLRLAIAATNRRADITDFATAIVANSGGKAYDPAVISSALLGTVPRFLFVLGEKNVRDVYSEVLGSIGWPAYEGGDQLADYQDSIFSSGVMALGVVGFVVVPLAYVWLLCWLGRLLERGFSGVAFGLTLLPLWLTSIQIEVDWPKMLLNIRQAASMAVVCLLLVAVLRELRRAVIIATWPPDHGRSLRISVGKADRHGAE